MFVELHASSAFSFLRGASLPEALVDRAADLGYDTMALVDRDGVYGAPRFHKAARAAGIRPIIGAALTLALPSGLTLPVLCENATGYQNLCRLITRMKLGAAASVRQGDDAPELLRKGTGEAALSLDDLDGHVSGLVALIGRPILELQRVGVSGVVDRLVGTFGRQGVCVEL